MRPVVEREKLLSFLEALARETGGEASIFLTGGATALLYGWRETTIDVDLKADPEPKRFFEALAKLKEQLQINLELASPDLFIPALPDWRERSIFVVRHGEIDFYHYDLYGQALAKLERGHPRDLNDVEEMSRRGLVQAPLLSALFSAIKPELIRFPAIEADSFSETVESWCGNH
ncbi:MAG: hypothetical protein O3A92_09360 [Verrucomicrobia bacterium]|nr:hypothetical protein [Verrucomicrobiota bacterium]